MVANRECYFYIQIHKLLTNEFKGFLHDVRQDIYCMFAHKMPAINKWLSDNL